MYVKDQPSKWEDYLHLVEFAYNNNYQALARFSPSKSCMEESVKLLFNGVIRWTG